jgi:hypothetical protein
MSREAHLRDDAEVTLAEQARGIGTVAVPVLLPALRRRQRAHAGAHHLAARQNHLHAAVRAEVVAIKAHRVADAVIQRVADRAAPTRIRRVDPQLQAAVLNVAIQVDVRDAGLDEREVAPRVHLEHAIHSLEIHGNAAAHVRRRAAVREILARRDRVQRNLELVRSANDRLHLLGGIRSHGGRRDQLVRLILDIGEVIAIRVDVLIAREHPVLADGRFELFDRGCEILRAYSGWQDGHRRSPCGRIV